MMKKAVFGLTIAVMVIVTTGCATRSGVESASARADLKWEDDAAAYLTVNNNVNEPLILFAGAVTSQHMLGGVHALASRRVDFFDKVAESSGVLLLRAIKESVYRSKGSSLDNDDVIFAGLVAFDKGNPTAVLVNINQLVGGEAYVFFGNGTPMAAQIRIDRPDGPVLTTLAPFERGQKVSVEPNPDGYMFFPVYEYYDRSSMSIRSVADRNTGGILIAPELPEPGRFIVVINFDAPRSADGFSIQLVNEQ
jgi:hypothetical protein